MRLLHAAYFSILICISLAEQDDDQKDENTTIADAKENAEAKQQELLADGSPGEEAPKQHEIDAGGVVDKVEAEMNTDGSVKIRPVSTVMSALPLPGDVVPLASVPHVFEAPVEDDSSEPEGGIKLKVVSETFGSSGVLSNPLEDHRRLMPKEKAVIVEQIGERDSTGVEPSEPVLPETESSNEMETESEVSLEIGPTSGSKPVSGPTSDIKRVPESALEGTTDNVARKDGEQKPLETSVEEEPSVVPEPEKKPEPEPANITTTTATTKKGTLPGGSAKQSLSPIAAVTAFLILLSQIL